MADIYDINFNQFAVNMLPPDKRLPNFQCFIQSLLAPLQWVRDLWFGSYRTGVVVAPWSAITYNKYDRVLYNKIVYESYVAANTLVPTDTTAWIVVQNNFIGLTERLAYNGGCLTLTWALNKWFGTVFRQPPLQSDIYLQTNVVVAPIFRVGATEDKSSSISTITSSEFVGISDGITTQINMTIFVPVAVYNALDAGLVNNDKIFRNFSDKYIPAGIIYTITTY
jgi:hypothetical protein